MEKVNPFLSAVVEKQSRARQPHAHSLDFLEGAVDAWATATGTIMSDDQRATWMLKLAGYPQWKLLEVDNYSISNGRTLGHVCKWLDDLRPAPPEQIDVRADMGYRQLEHKPNESGVKDTVMRYLRNLDRAETPAQKDQVERDWISEMHRKHPHVKVHHQRRANLGKNHA